MAVCWPSRVVDVLRPGAAGSYPPRFELGSGVGGSRADYKPGSVPHYGGGGHLSRTPVARRLQRPQPEGWASSLVTRRARRPAGPLAGNALLFGLAPRGVCLAGRSPGRRWALTPPFHPYRLRLRNRRCHFCGTFLRVTPTGRYPARCSVEPGLSSPLLDGAERPPVRLDPHRCYDLAFCSSMARLASASAPRFFSRGTCMTAVSPKPWSSCSALAWSGRRSLFLTR